MLVLYAGYPAAFAALEGVRAEWPASTGAGTRPASRANERRRGLALCRRVYGPVLPRLLRRVRGLHSDIARWMVEEGYGRVLSRRGMAARERALVTVAALAALGWEPQLVSHLLGAARLAPPARSAGLPGPPVPRVRVIARRVRPPCVRGGGRTAWRGRISKG